MAERPAANAFELEPLASPFHHDPPARARPKRSVRRCAAYTCLAFGILAAGGLLYAGYNFLTWGYTIVSDPHSPVIYNGTVHSDLGASVVYPLIDHDTKFDIIATVLLRDPDSITKPVREEWLSQRNERLRTMDGWDEAEIRALEMKEEVTAGSLHVDVTEFRTWASEKILWSGYLARGRVMGDKPLDTSVTFDVPVERFYDPILMRRDLRMGIAIVPHSPSRLDRLEDFTDCRGDVLDQSPRAIDSKLLNGLNLTRGGLEETDDNQYDLLETMTGGYTLLEFHELPNPCGETIDELSDDKAEEEDLYASVQSDEDKQVEEVEEVANTTKADEGPGRHPFILTRSHFYMINETRPYERKAFDKRHKILRETSCGRGVSAFVPTWMKCHRGYKSHGHWETRLVLHPATPGGKKELAYAPYVSRLPNAAGPGHITKVPVSRAVCDGVPQDRSNDPKTITVTHEIRFSTLSAARMTVLEHFMPSDRLGHNATEVELVQAHDFWSQTVGIWGDRQPGSHPWRRMIIFILGELTLPFPIFVLSALYWYTRQTATGLSHIGTCLCATGMIIELMSMFAWSALVNGFFDGFMTLLFDGWSLVTCYYMLRIVFPWEWVGKWAEGVRRSRWTHRERKSMRIGASIPWIPVVLLVVLVWGVTYTLQSRGIHVVQPRLDDPLEPHLQRWYSSDFVLAFPNSLQLVGHWVQLEFNRRSGTFAGGYALTTYLQVVAVSLRSLTFIDRFIGVYEARAGMSYNDLLQLMTVFAMAWQAYTLPRVDQDVIDTEEE